MRGLKNRALASSQLVTGTSVMSNQQARALVHFFKTSFHSY